MLKSKYRLLRGEKAKPREISSTPFFILKSAENDSSSRFAFAVSKKVDKRAVIRNRVRRKVRGCIEKNILNIKPGYNFIFIIKKEAIDAKEDDICQSIYKELDKKGFLIK
jgi:ribonuclease P protein component